MTEHIEQGHWEAFLNEIFRRSIMVLKLTWRSLVETSVTRKSRPGSPARASPMIRIITRSSLEAYVMGAQKPTALHRYIYQGDPRLSSGEETA